jgi:hypothetical protein
MNDDSNFGADFHCEPNSIIKLKGEDFNEYPQPRNGAPETTDAYVSQLKTDPYAANLVLAVPGIDSNTNPELVTNGDFSNGTTGWIALSEGSISVEDGKLKITETSGVNPDAYACNSTAITTEVGKTYTIKWTFTEGTNTSFTVRFGNSGNQSQEYQSNSATGGSFPISGSYAYTFTATATTLNLSFIVNQSGTYGYLSNVSVKEAVPVRDYSADIKGSGTNRTPTLDKCGVTSPVPSYYGSAISTGGAGDYLYYDLDGTDYGTNDFTFECWFYAIEEPSNWGILMKHATNGSWANGITLNSKNNTTRTFTIYTHNGSTNFVTSSSTVWELNQWHHVVAERYNNTLTLYVNGVAHATRDVTGHNYNVAGTPASSAQYGLSVGAQSNGDYQSNGYFNDVRVYKGVAKYKGGFDVPKPYTPVGIATWRAVPDTTANNFATLNPLKSGMTLSDGNLKATSTGYSATLATIGAKTGKYYYEGFVQDVGGTSFAIGVGFVNTNTGTYGGAGTYDIVYAGSLIYGNSTNLQTGLSSPVAGDTIGVALNLDSSVITFYKNGVLVTSENLTSGIEYFPCVADNSLAGTVISVINFGQNPTFSGTTTAGTYTDSNGKGLFKYEPPSGFLALCEDNLPTPAIKNPGEYFKSVLWTGDGNSGRSIVGVGFTPDLVWVKERTSTSGHFLTDSVRGVNELLSSNTTGGTVSGGGQCITSFNQDGFSVGNDGAFNENTQNYVAWCWKAGGSAVTNTDGTITSQVSVNQDAGFSIVSYTGNSNASATVGHNLGKKPSLMIVKERTSTSTSGGIWAVYHYQTNTVQFLNLPDAGSTISGGTNGSVDIANATSTVFPFINGASSVNNWNNNGSNYIAYCWAEIEGFSKFGSYVGNLNADGPFVYCGFKPAWVLIKRTDTTGSWGIWNSSVDSTNPSFRYLLTNDPGVEQTGTTHSLDFLSNGFKIRNDQTFTNASGGTYIFAAFAESPFQTANAK